MLGRIKFLFIYYLVWVAFFEVARALFLFYHFSHAQALSIDTVLLTFVYGLRLDLSMAAYILVPVCLFVLLSVFVPFFRKAVSYKVYSFTILFFVLLIIVADLEVYKQWGFRMDATPLKYLSSPKEAWASISHLPVFLILTLFILVYLGICYLVRQLLNRIINLLQGKSHQVVSFLLVAAVMPFLIVPIRGGLQLAPINQSSVYFSANNFANLAAINAPWNFLHGIFNKASSTYNPYNYLEPKHARKVVDSLYAMQGSRRTVLNTTTPNVLMIIWESFTDKATDTSINGKEVTPRFNQLKQEGIYFSNVYASGDRTDKGLSAILSGYPAMPNSSIIRVPNKAAKLASISRLLKEKGYAIPFYYGGEPEFANIKSYLRQGAFDPLIDVNDFRAEDRNSKWGAHDGVVAKRLFDDLQTIRLPFFATWLTLTSHEPFETPDPPVFEGKEHVIQFLNSHHYTDKVVYDFIQRCKKQAWWKNTLVIIVGDHGHSLPQSKHRWDNFTIPMLWLGGALNQTGVVVTQTISQLDIATTLTKQLGVQGNPFPFSKDIFDSTSKQWAFFSFNNGFGFMQPAKKLVFDNVGKQLIEQEGVLTDSDLHAGKAMQQMTFQDYLDK